MATLGEDRVQVVCPCCSTRLVVDAGTGEILSEQRPELDARKTFEDAMHKVQSGSQRREAEFEKAFDRTRRLDDLLEKKFEEARKQAEKDPKRPTNPLDLD